MWLFSVLGAPDDTFSFTCSIQIPTDCGSKRLENPTDDSGDGLIEVTKSNPHEEVVVNYHLPPVLKRAVPTGEADNLPTVSLPHTNFCIIC